MIAEKGVIIFSFSLQWEGKQLFSAVHCAGRAGVITQSFLPSSNLILIPCKHGKHRDPNLQAFPGHIAQDMLQSPCTAW